MFDKVKQLNDLRKQSQEMDKQLASEVIEVVHKGVLVRISANTKVIAMESNGKNDEIIVDAINKSIKEVQKIAAKKMRGQLSSLGIDLPGM